MPSEILLQFNNLPSIDEGIALGQHPSLGNIFPSFKTQRTGFNQVTIGINNVSQRSQFRFAFDTDFNVFNEFELTDEASIPGTSGFDRLRIKYNGGQNFFNNATDFTGGDITIVSITNSPDLVPLSVTSFEYQENAINPCTKINLSLTTTAQIDFVRFSGNVININTNPFTLELDRGLIYKIYFYVGLEEHVQTFYPPTQFFINRVDQNLTPNGYNLTVDITADNSLNNQIINELEYSLDDVNWQLSSSFTGLIPDDYIIRVRDPYGCKKQINYTIVDDQSSVERLDPYFEISKLNSFHFALQDDKKFENFNNTLSYEESGLNYHNFRHLVQQDDIIPIQFRSNYDIHNCKLIDVNDNETVLDVVKKSNNINIFDSRDGYLTLLEDNFVGVFLNGGNVYDPITNDVTGQNTIIKRIPSFYTIGRFIKLGILGWYQITSVFYDETLQAWVAGTNYIAGSVTSDPIILTVNYNQLNYEVYEFTPDFTSLEACYQIQLQASNDNEIVTYLSEIIDVRVEHPNTHELKCSNTENNEINYQTGITHLLRLPYITNREINPNIEVETNRSDTKISHLRGMVTDRVRFEFCFVPGAIVKKIARMVVLDRPFINGIGYTDPDIDSEKLGNTNLYDVTVELTPSNEQFQTNSNLRVVSNLDTGGFIEVAQGEGFIRHDN
ncbi:hypothetical protein [Aquimarina sp. 2201CG5-10]|uniref:hypothetical protein n=1 Tax=Aquimarina callyspongiae TaxID=3098150 RepID=UPI002AB5217E|nr:hypothetical protein [Aquimarina sp. 2201CG5-10]MDY8137557.1 hypothetical protein [Aquimarina sp. 2201CG5-10]